MGRQRVTRLAWLLLFGLGFPGGCSQPRAYRPLVGSGRLRASEFGPRSPALRVSGPLAEAEAALAEGDRSLFIGDALRSYGRAASLATASAGGPGGWEAARDLHNRALARLLDRAGAGDRRGDWPGRLASAGIAVEAIDPAVAGIEQVRPASEFELDGVSARHVRAGWGLPMVAFRDLPGDADDRVGVDRFHPNRPSTAATAWMRADPSGAAVLELGDPRNRQSVLVDGVGPLPMAADFTTPLMIALQHPSLLAFEPLGVVNPEALWRRTGIAMLAPYQPGKIPVLLVHGLWSDPQTWLSMLNAFEADPAIRGRYQFWVAFYATGYAPPVNAWRIRNALAELRGTIDPAHADPSLDRMVVVSHSMGGVVAKLLVQESGDEVRQSLLRVPLDRLDLADDSRRFFEEVLYFRPDPSIRRLVLIGVPHRGSSLANEFDARYGAILVRRRGPGPDQVRELVRRNGRDVLQPGLGRSPLSGVYSLSADQPMLLAFNRLPFAPGVELHSIIGIDESRVGLPIESTDDGIVPYASAHLEGVPETFVVGDHRGLTSNAGVIAEVRRILEAHPAGYNSGP